MKKLAILILLISSIVHAQENIEEKLNFPNPIGYTNDFESILSDEEKSHLNKIINDFEQKTTNEIAIVTIKTIGTYTDFEKYAFDLSVNWGVGKKEKDNGLTIVVSEKYRAIRINTGSGTAKIISDEFLKEVIDHSMIPEFKNRNYYNGIKNGLEEIINEWKLKG